MSNNHGLVLLVLYQRSHGVQNGQSETTNPWSFGTGCGNSQTLVSQSKLGGYMFI